MRYVILLLILISTQLVFGQKTIEEKIQATANGSIIPNFKIYDSSGNAFNFYDLKAEVIVLDIWASWCGPCRRQAPYFEKIRKELESDKVLFLSISIDRKMKKWQRFLRKKGLSEQQYWAGNQSEHPIEWFTYSVEGAEKQEYIVAAVPRFVIIGENYKILNRNADFASQSLKRQIQLILKE